MTRLSRQRAGNDGGVEAAELIREHVVPGDATLQVVFRVGAGVNGVGGRLEAHAVGGDDIARSPNRDDRQGVVRGDDPRVGGGERFGADEVLAEPGQAVPRERRNVRPDQGLETDVAGLGDEDGAEAGVEVFDPSLPFAQMREGMGELCALHDFENGVGQIHLRQAPLHFPPQRLQTRRLVELVQHRDDDLRRAVDMFDAESRIVRHARGDISISSVEKLTEGGDLGARIERAVQRPADHRLRRLPGGSIQKSMPRIAIARTRLGENIAPPDGRSPGGDNRKDIGLRIGDLILVVEDISPPGLGNGLRRRVAQILAAPLGPAFEIGDSFPKGVPIGRRAGLDSCRHVEEEPTCAPPALAEFGIRFGVFGLGGRFYACLGRLDLGARQFFKQRLSPCLKRKLVVGEDHLAHTGQDKSGSGKIARTFQASLIFSRFRSLDHVDEKRLGQFDRVILRRRLQCVEERGDGRGSARLGKRQDCRGSSNARNTRESFDHRGGNALGRDRPQIESADGVEPVEMPQEFVLRAAVRWRSQCIELIEVGGISAGEQEIDAYVLILREAIDELAPQSSMRPITDATDEPLQCRPAGQQDFVGDEPGNSLANQRRRPIIATPAQRIKPPGQPQAGKSVFGEVGKAVFFADQRHMANSSPAGEIIIKRHNGFDVELPPQAHKNRLRDIRFLTWKDADEPCGAEHQRKAKAIMIAPKLSDNLAVGFVEMKISREFVGRGISCKSRVLSALFVGQKLHRHFSQNPPLLRSRTAPRKTGALRLAKTPCVMKNFRDGFCNRRGVAA
jgi:hypothetical protein